MLHRRARFLSAGLALLLLAQPVLLLAQSADATEAMRVAEMDAQADLNTTMWFVAGCTLGVVGWVAAYAVQPKPPASRLLGQSPEYVAMYTDVYSRRAKELQASKALTGCLVGTGITALFYVALIGAIAAGNATP